MKFICLMNFVSTNLTASNDLHKVLNFIYNRVEKADHLSLLLITVFIQTEPEPYPTFHPIQLELHLGLVKMVY